MLFTFPSRYLFAIGHVRVFRLGGWSPHIQTELHVFRPTQVLFLSFRIRDCHPLWSHFPESFANKRKGTGLVPVRSPLLRESRLMSFPPGTEMFQFPGFASPSLCVQLGDTLSTSPGPPEDGLEEMVKVGFPIRKSSDQRLLTSPRRLSQRATSFIACMCQGIHQMLLPHA